MTDLLYYLVCSLLTLTILLGIALMSKVKTAVLGNRLSAIATFLAIVITLSRIYTDVTIPKELIISIMLIILITILIGSSIGIYLTNKVKMIQMPELVAILNGLGGLASAIVGACSLFIAQDLFELSTAIIALIVGTITFTGSLIAGLKLAKLMNARPIVWKRHAFITTITLIILISLVSLTIIKQIYTLNLPILTILLLALIFSGFFGVVFAIRVGGADMPITISLLNSLSGVAGAIAGMAINDILLVAVGGIVGASGLLLTQIMCKAMNRSLIDILLGKTSIAKKVFINEESKHDVKAESVNLSDVLKQAKKVIIVPGYGMALAQAQHLVKQLTDTLEKNGTEVKFAIHPVAGRMPGHMNVLLCEVDIPYELLFELNDINDEFKESDVCIVIGANDVINPAAREAIGTPIYGMPILNVDQAKHIIICNYDLKPGYAGVENPLYHRQDGMSFLFGDAKETLQKLLSELQTIKEKPTKEDRDYIDLIKRAKNVIIVPGYGMALAQAQQLVKQLTDKLVRNGTCVKFAIHPVAGRMPGHMNVLLCEVGIEYEDLYEINAINDDFKESDVCIVIGANDVINPAAREAMGTPIYGMPILNVDQAKHIIILNYDLKPGYAGVDNPIYKQNEGVTLLLGNASETLQELLNQL